MLLAASSSSTSSGGSAFVSLLLPVLLLVGLYFVLIRPQRTRQRAQQSLLSQLEVNDEIMTTGGIFGTIIEIDEEGVLTVEIAPGTRVRMLRQGVAQRFVEDEDAGDDDDQASDEEADRQP